MAYDGLTPSEGVMTMSKPPKWLKQYRKKQAKARKNWTTYQIRDKALAAMGFQSYTEYLASDLWQTIRAKRLALGDGCSCCDNPAAVVHHDKYYEGLLRGEEAAIARDLYPLCHGCHLQVEFIDGRKRSGQEAVIRLRQMLFRRRHGMSKGERIRQKIAKKKAERAANHEAAPKGQRPKKKKVVTPSEWVVDFSAGPVRMPGVPWPPPEVVSVKISGG
jgi:hypothetical protein